MAKVKFNQTLTSMNGAVGDYVFTRQGEETIARRRSPGAKGQSEQQAVQRSLTSEIAGTWNDMDFVARNGWVLLQQKLGYKTAYLCFASLTKIMVNNGGQISPDAPDPDTVEPPALLPQNLQVAAVNTGSAFTLHLTGGTYTGGKVRIFATKAVPEAQSEAFKADAFKPIVTLASIGINQDITAAYVQRWGTVGVGGKMAFYLQAVSENGVKSGKMFRVALVGEAAAQEADAPLQEAA